jgi:LPXTG-motif cell wall-anchored protein
MFSFTPSGTRRVRAISGLIAAGAMIAAFTLSASSASAILPGPTAPTNVVAPTISGTVAVGNTLTVDNGTWDDDGAAPYTYTYAWQDDQGNSLTTSSSYTIIQQDEGHQLTAIVTATDTNDNATDVEVLTTDVPTPDFTNTVAPVISGGLTEGDTLTVSDGTWSKSGLTITYDWGYSGGQSGGQDTPVDSTNTHVTDSNDFGQTPVGVVTATDATGSVTVSAFASGIVTPAAPVATDAGLTVANEGGVTGSQSGNSATVTLPAPAAPDDLVYVYGYSTATPIGFFTVDANNQIVVSLSALAAGSHKLAIINSNGVLIGWFAVTATGDPSLPTTGVNVNVPLELGGAAMLLVVGFLSVLYVRRRNRLHAGA